MTKRAQITTSPERLKILTDVFKHLEDAHRLLSELRPKEKMGDVGYFADEIAELISSDDGECGFKAYVELFRAAS